MKSKKGFTLIELLSIIVILAIIAVITVPIVLNIVDNSKKGAITNSAYGYKDAISKYYISRLSIDSNFMMADNIYTIDENGYLSYVDDSNTENNILYEIQVDGTIPSNGYVQLVKNDVKKACIQFDDYSVLIIDGFVSDTLKGECSSVDEVVSSEEPYLALGTEYPFSYVDNSDVKEQSLIISRSGYYKLEVWGAQGGSIDQTYIGGYGGYSSGVVSLKNGDILYINVGGKSSDYDSSVFVSRYVGGYNGGGYGYKINSDVAPLGGGGATHIALKSGLLSSLNNDIDDILIVAGGGAGAYRYSGGAWSGASGGGFIGGYRSDSSMAGMQDGGYSFGQASDTYETFSTSSNHSGGGGGFYGGHSRWDGYAGGGSGYIGNELLIDGVMYCYDCSENGNPGVVTISTTGDNKDSINCPNSYSSSALTNCAKAENGYAKITYLGESID